MATPLPHRLASVEIGRIESNLSEKIKPEMRRFSDFEVARDLSRCEITNEHSGYVKVWSPGFSANNEAKLTRSSLFHAPPAEAGTPNLHVSRVYSGLKRDSKWANRNAFS